MAAIAQRNSQVDGHVQHVRDATYARWRYRNPQSDYCFAFAGGDAPSGYLALRTARAGRSADAAIVDWDADEPVTLRRMLEAIQRSGAFDSLTLWSATLPATLAAALGDLGFREIDATRGIKDFTPGLLVRELHEGDDDPGAAALRLAGADADRWKLRMIYSDYF